MALNDYRGNSYGGSQRKAVTYYSRYHCANYSELTRLNISFFNGMLKLTIAQAPAQDQQYEDKISLCLTSTKAKLLLEAMGKFEEEFSVIGMKEAFGVPTGMSDTVTVGAFHKNDRDGKAFTIAQVNQAGSVIKRFDFNFPAQTDSYITWQDFNTMKNTKEFDDDLQYQMLKDTLIDFVKTAGGASGYNAIDLARYDINRQNNNIETVMDKLGVPRRHTNNNYTRSSSGNYFSNSGSTGTQSTTKSLDEIDDYISGDDEE